jgi:heme exporter protein B
MILTLVKKEFLLVGKSLHGILSMLVLSSTLLFLFHFSFEKNSTLSLSALIGIKWSILFVTSYILIGQSTWEEREGGAGNITRLFIPTWVTFILKSFVIWFFLVIVTSLILLLMSVFFINSQIETYFNQILFLLPSSLSLSFLGVSLSGVSASTRMKEILLPLLLVPFSIPIFLYGLNAEFRYLQDKNSLTASILILILFCCFYGGLGVLFQEIQSENMDG